MKTFYQGEEVFFAPTFWSDRGKTTGVDPSDVVFELEDPSGTTITPTVDENGARPDNEGKYISSYVVDSYGVWAWRWETENPRFVRQGQFRVIQNNQED